MASYTIRDCDPATVQAARDRARDAGTDLASVLRAYLAAYADGTDAATAGGHARAAVLTPEERSDSARRAAQARWRR